MATFTNQATLSYNGVTRNSNVATGELLDVLTVTKTALQTNYVSGDTVTYAVSIRNTGANPQTAVTLTDNLGEYAYNAATLYPLTYVDGSARLIVDGVLQPDPAVVAGPPMTVTGISIPAGGNATLIYEARVNEFASPVTGTVINNTATVNGAGVNARLTATAPVTADPAANLQIRKAIDPVTVSAGDTVTYTFTLLNYGNTAVEAGGDATVADTFDPALTNLAVAYNGTPWAAPANYTYDAGTGAFATVPGQIAVPAATYTQDAATGAYTVTPGVGTLTVSGTI